MADRFFPIDTNKASWSDTIGIQWAIQKQESASGLIRAIVEQDLPKYEYALSFPMLSKAEAESIIGFFNICRGQLLPFYIKGYNAHVEKQELGKLPDGKYQLVKKHGDFVEPVERVENLEVFVNGSKVTNYTESGGKITLSTSGTVTASYDYFDKVRFGGNISLTEKFENVWSCSIKVVTAR